MNSSDRVAIDRYAVAFDKLSANVEQATSLFEDLKIASQALSKCEEYMKNPQVSIIAKKALIKEALKSNTNVASFIEILLDSKRYNLLPFIVEQIASLLEQRMGVMRALVISAREVSAEQKQQIEAVLSKRYNKVVKAQFKKEATLLGGLKIFCNGELIDGSLQGKLLRLQTALTR